MPAPSLSPAPRSGSNAIGAAANCLRRQRAAAGLLPSVVEELELLPARCRRASFVAVAEALEALAVAQESGTAFILGYSLEQGKPGSSVLKQLAVDIGYNFLRRNCRGPDLPRVPPASLLEVGTVCVL